jgi:hypothetical protein
VSVPVPESDSAFSLEKTNRLRGMLIVGIFIFHFCGMFPHDSAKDRLKNLKNNKY